MIKYSELLKDPRWKARREQILKRDGYKCVRCGDGSKTFNVHHLVYENGRNPWEYEDEFLITLCDECHEKEHETVKMNTDLLIDVFKRKGFLSDDIFAIAEGLNDLERFDEPPIMAAVIAFIFSNPSLLSQAAQEYHELIGD